MAGQPKTFTSDEFEKLVYQYLEHISQNQEMVEDKSKAIIPTYYDFYLYCNKIKPCNYRTIRRNFDEYCPHLKEEFENIRGDLLVQGAGKGLYNPTISVFALKNWCNWKDKTEQDTNISGLNITIKDAEDR